MRSDSGCFLPDSPCRQERVYTEFLADVELAAGGFFSLFFFFKYIELGRLVSLYLLNSLHNAPKLRQYLALAVFYRVRCCNVTLALCSMYNELRPAHQMGS